MYGWNELYCWKFRDKQKLNTQGIKNEINNTKNTF